MPDLRLCRRGCSSKKKYYCRHRFGRDVGLVVQPGRLVFTRLKDIQVILDFLFIINHQFRKYRGKRRFVLVTHDHNFLGDARREHEAVPYSRHPQLAWGDDWVQFGNGHRLVRIEVKCIPHANRDADLATVANIVRKLRASS